MAHLRALLILLTCAFIGILGTPGLDFIKVGDLETPKERQEAVARYGHPWADIGIAIASFNREVRFPIVRRLEPLQRVPRISQNWSLYRDGPGKLRRMEIYVDDTLRYRSVDPEHAWLGPQLRSRRVRPVVESTTIQYESQNWRGLARYIIQCAQRDFPGVQKVELVATEGRFGQETLKPRFAILATAPAWEPERRWLVEPPKKEESDPGSEP